LVCFVAIWYRFYGCLVYVFPFGHIVPIKVWQHCFAQRSAHNPNVPYELVIAAFKRIIQYICISNMPYTRWRSTFAYLDIVSRVARWFIFQPKIPIRVNFGGPWNGEGWYILYSFEIYYGHLVHFMSFW
jgi:hypothetical protein